MKRGPISYGDPIEVVVHSTCGVQWEDPIDAALNGISRVSLGVIFCVCVCVLMLLCFLVFFLVGLVAFSCGFVRFGILCADSFVCCFY